MKLKVLSLNIWIGGKIFEPMIQFLKEQDADIVLLQEVFDGKDVSLAQNYRTLDMLSERCSYPYVKFAPTTIDEVNGQDVIQGNAILSKFPLQEVQVIFYDVPFGKRVNHPSQFHVTPRSLQHAIAEVGEKKLHLLNTQGIWGEDGEDNERRIKMGQKIVQEINGHSPLLLAGDFNVQEGTKTIAQIEEKLLNVFAGELKTSFNTKRKDIEKYPGFATAVVDMLFVSRDVKVIHKSVPQADISDHLPFIVEIEI